MFDQTPSNQEPILQTIALTTKLEKHLRKLISGKKSTLQQTIEHQRTHQQGTISALQRQIQRLQQENKQLFMDNEQVCRDVLRLRDENRQLKKEVGEHKKYIHHLQGYNEELKKQLMFWMRKPTKSQQYCQKGEDSVGILMTEVLKLRRENEVRQSELPSLGQTLQIKQIKIPPLAKKFAFNLDSIPKITKQGRHKRANTFSTKLNECTSCNYHQLSTKAKRVESNRSLVRSHKRQTSKNLCECHRQYVWTSQFKC